MAEMITRPMFPLGSVVIPGAVLPLHVFEPRYRALVHAVLSDDGIFGTVLIERGSEVGGGDTRSIVGTTVQVIDGHAFPDGRYALAVLGLERIRVLRWLDDDPYPRAEVDPWPDPDPIDCGAAVAELADILGRLATRRASRGATRSAVEADLPPDPLAASYAAVLSAQLGPLDAYRALTCPDVPSRLAFVTACAAAEVELLDLEDRL